MAKKKTALLVTCALCLALCLVLPFLTAQIPSIGRMLCPMHIPVLLCGFLTTPLCALTVGLIAPLMRSLLFGVPVLFPTAIGMAFELATYGLAAALFYRRLHARRFGILISLVLAMLAGRAVLGIANTLLLGFSGRGYSLAVFWADAFAGALPGIALQLVVVPVLVRALHKNIPALRPY